MLPLLSILIHFSLFSTAYGVHMSTSIHPTRPNLLKSGNTKILSPAPAPAPSHVKKHGFVLNHPVLRHRKALPPEAFPTPHSQPPTQACDEISCSDPLTSTPIGSPCGCVYPMQLQLDLGVSPYQLFSRIADLEVDVATGTFLKQSQVRIMGASASIHDPTKTTVTIDLVPLGEKFDRTTALLTFERFWQKKVAINISLFGDYDVLYIHYPGLPSSPSPMYVGSSGSSGNGIHQYPFTASIPKTKSQKKLDRKFIAIITVCVFVLVLACSGLLWILIKLKQYQSSVTAVGSTVNSSAIRKNGIKSTVYSSSLASSSASFDTTLVTSAPSVKTFSLAELEKATGRFSSSKLLGQGGFGRVYHGVMDDGSEVAIKLLTRENQYGDREFIAEIEMLSRLHHRNLVKLIGVCIEGRTRCLIYELVRNGSLESHLHGVDKTKRPLDWEARMKIALGAARALAYLHEDSNPRVIHRDFKASNVLLEDDYTPKVSDFGLAREASEGIDHISTHVMGTFGYVAPEYAMTGHLLVKSDVYSYGVVLLELLSGRKPVYMSRPHRPENLVTWARPLLKSKEGLEQLIDPSLAGKYDFESVAKVSAIASMCVHIEASQRPFMGEVVQALKLIVNDMDEVCDNSFSLNESLGTDCDLKGGYESESCWWNSATPPRLTFGCASSFVTVDYGSSPVQEPQRPHSTSNLVEGIEYLAGLNMSGPIKTRTKWKRQTFYRFRGSKSERGHPSRRFRFDGP